MKKIIIIAILMSAALTSFAQSGKSIYTKYSGQKNVSAVYISQAMFKMIGKMPEIEVEDVDIAPAIRSLDGLYIISSENSAINGKLKSDVMSYVKSGKFELMMEAKDEGETVQMYTDSEGDIIKSFVLLSFENDECNFISFDGNMKRQDLEKLLSQQKKK